MAPVAAPAGDAVAPVFSKTRSLAGGETGRDAGVGDKVAEKAGPRRGRSSRDGIVSLSLYRGIVEDCPDAVVVIGRDRIINYVNQAAETMFARRRTEMIGQPLEILIPEQARGHHPAHVEAFQSGAASARHMGQRLAPTLGLRGTGEQFPVAISILKTYDRDELQMVAIVRDITERKRLEDDLKWLASTDSLTGILNRRMFVSRIEEERARSIRSGEPLALAMIDADHFKMINDVHGHAFGDEALKHIVRAVSAEIRTADVFGRWGGEEFALLLPATGEEGAAAIAERLRCRIAEPAFSVGQDGEPVFLTVSIGVALLRTGEDTVDAFIQRADEALYAAKSAGRNRISIAPAG